MPPATGYHSAPLVIPNRKAETVLTLKQLCSFASNLETCISHHYIVRPASLVHSGLPLSIKCYVLPKISLQSIVPQLSVEENEESIGKYIPEQQNITCTTVTSSATQVNILLGEFSIFFLSVQLYLRTSTAVFFRKSLAVGNNI